MDRDRLVRTYADLAVRAGCNLQPGQRLLVQTVVEHAPFARAVARAAYVAGARHVEVLYEDQHVRKAMIEHASETSSRGRRRTCWRRPRTLPPTGAR